LQAVTLDVDQLTARIQALLLQDPVLQSLSLRGEILDLKKHTSGHVYFTLTGSESRISCVMFRSDAKTLPKWPRKGDEVIVQGRVSIYPPRGSYQFYARQIYPLGEGAAARAKAELKQRLEKEGLFDPSHKRKFPEFPSRIAVITSPTGAAVRDVINVSGRLFPSCEIVVVPVLVQGAEAPKEISRGFIKCGSMGGLDAVMLVRGGGSRDDLNPFDEEDVIRAVRNCPFPVMTGLGHETDLTLSDLAADGYASTPSAAAESIMPDQKDVIRRIVHLRERMTSLERAGIDMARRNLSSLCESAEKRMVNITENVTKDLSLLHSRLVESSRRIVSEKRQKVEYLGSHLNALSPEYVLSRGFITCEDPETGHIVPFVKNVEEGRTYVLRFSDGSADAKIEKKFNKEGEDGGNQ